jgi:glutamate racemase
MAKNLPVIALDLDFTLARFQNGHAGIYGVIEKFGIDKNIAATTLRSEVDSVEWLIWANYAEKLLPGASKALAHALELHFEDDFSWYPGVLDTLKYWKSLGIPLIVVTAGSKLLQSQKIKLLNFPFNAVYITPPQSGKAKAIQEIADTYPDQKLIYLDDKIVELERIAQGCSHMLDSRLSLFCMNHGDREVEAHPSFPIITQFDQIFPPKHRGKLGFFDSGIGGLTVLEAFHELYPDMDMEYFWDCKNCPYGDRNPEEILALVTLGVDELVLSGCVIIILACNTAVAHAVRYLQQEKYPPGSPVKILGVTLPGAEKVVELGLHHVGVLATQATVNNRTYRDRVQVLNPDILVQEVAAPGLVNLIEQEVQNIWEINNLLRKTLKQFDPNIQSLVLGCTHYPLVAQNITQIWQSLHGTPLPLIDPGYEAAKRFGAYVARHPEFMITRGGNRTIQLNR